MQQLTLLVSLSLFTSCQNDDKGSKGTIETFEQQIIVDYEDKRQIQGFIDCINDVNLIPLEMDSAFLSSDNTLKVTSDKLIFLDNEKDRIEVFNHQGDYLNTGKHTVPESSFKKQEKRIDEDLMEITLEMINKDWFHSIGFFHEATQYVNFVSSKKGSYYTLYDRTTEETYTANWAEIPQGWIDILSHSLRWKATRFTRC